MLHYNKKVLGVQIDPLAVNTVHAA